MDWYAVILWGGLGTLVVVLVGSVLWPSKAPKEKDNE